VTHSTNERKALRRRPNLLHLTRDADPWLLCCSGLTLGRANASSRWARTRGGGLLEHDQPYGSGRTLPVAARSLVRAHDSSSMPCGRPLTLMPRSGPPQVARPRHVARQRHVSARGSSSRRERDRWARVREAIVRPLSIAQDRRSRSNGSRGRWLQDSPRTRRPRQSTHARTRDRKALTSVVTTVGAP
jgi:hypothetical protein